MKVAMVTGPTSGIGRAVTVGLASMGFHVVAAGRSQERLARLMADLTSRGASAEPLQLDLASFESITAAARAFEATDRKLDVLVNNAGVGAARGATSEGFETQFGVNHLGHFLLTHDLRRALQPGSRVIQVSSEAHRRATGIDFDRVTRPSKSWLGWSEYATSKLANILFVRELARRQPEWASYAVHPGLVDTPLFPALIRPLVRRTAVTPEQGADTIVWCATEGPPPSGGYFFLRAEREPSAVARDDALAAELWARSERWCHVGPVDADS